MQVVKELVENSLDAGAKTVEVLLSDLGVERVEVRDDGCGLDMEGQGVGRGATSKLDTFDNIDNINTYGFRGQALGCIGGLAEELVITT